MKSGASLYLLHVVVCQLTLSMADASCLEKSERPPSSSAHCVDDVESLLHTRQTPSASKKRSSACSALHQPLKDPPVVGSDVTLKVGVVKLSDPGPCLFGHGSDTEEVQTWYTRAYGTDELGFAVPGPTIKVRRGERLRIKIENQLEASRFECLDDSAFCGVNNTNLHLHGMHVTPREGGDDVMSVAKGGETMTVEVDVPNYHSMGTFWYHPHAHHSTAVQAGGGMHGGIVVEDDAGSIPDYLASMQEHLLVLSLLDLRFSSQPGIVGWFTGASNPLLEKNSKGDLWRNQHGEYVDNNEVSMLVNGQLIPKMTLRAGQWHRFRMIYASTELSCIISALELEPGNGFRCDIELLAKDGVYLRTTPREIEKIYLASGNRADIAIRCFCTGKGSCEGSLSSVPDLGLEAGSEEETYHSAPLDEAGYIAPWLIRARTWPVSEMDEQVGVKKSFRHNTRGPFANRGEPTLLQELVRLTIEPSDSHSPNLRRFQPPTPCYLVDLRDVEVPAADQGILSLPKPQGPSNPPWQTIYWSHPSDPLNYTGERMIHHKDFPALHSMPLGSVQELKFSGPPVGYDQNNAAFRIGGISYHSIHIHVLQYQITQLLCQDGTWIGPHPSKGCSDDKYFMVGDFMDTLVYGGGQAVVRMQVTKFTGKYVVHCHILPHEDMGMMSYFEVTGEEGTVWTGARKVDPHCYYGEGTDPGSNKYKFLDADEGSKTGA
eukprot:TRINITY_DN9053_c0_g1_i1.p1 TRINITY_DN9053_c0_g1~~TRINITY_DN9053_c0_g1_i1.p1  ORF type:complete len:716 (-),score=67.20 TRINITY_DN9053_c0_g1_i1:254-2401(-)